LVSHYLWCNCPIHFLYWPSRLV